jgi:aspartate 1-decarboxylase
MKQRIFITAKIHRATVTDANLNYKGSISLCPELIKAAGLLPYEFVHVNNLANGNHWETYIIPGAPGAVTLNGPPARLFCAGDKVVINRLEHVTPDEIAGLTHTVVYVDESNNVLKTETHHVIEGN